jgi:hypothetical protein
MSTNINITVGNSGLLDRAKQQQAASRQTQLNREAATQLETQATAARTAAFAAQGRDLNGNLITGAPFTQPQIDRRPTATRRVNGYPVTLFYLSLRIFGETVDVLTSTRLATASLEVPSADSLLLPGFSAWQGLVDINNVLVATKGSLSSFPIVNNDSETIWKLETLYLLYTQDSFILPINGNTAIYCFWEKAERRLWEFTLIRDNTTGTYSQIEVYSQLAGYEVSACFLINRDNIRILPAMPAPLLSIINSKNYPLTFTERESPAVPPLPPLGPEILNDAAIDVISNDERSRQFTDPGFSAGIYESLGLLASGSLPPVSLEGFISDDGTYLELKSTRDRPATVDSVFAANPAARIGWEPPENYGVAAGWDWGQPGYCRARLLELGFQPEDFVF